MIIDALTKEAFSMELVNNVLSSSAISSDETSNGQDSQIVLYNRDAVLKVTLSGDIVDMFMVHGLKLEGVTGFQLVEPSALSGKENVEIIFPYLSIFRELVKYPVEEVGPVMESITGKYLSVVPKIREKINLIFVLQRNISRIIAGGNGSIHPDDLKKELRDLISSVNIARVENWNLHKQEISKDQAFRRAVELSEARSREQRISEADISPRFYPQNHGLVPIELQ